MDQSFTDRVDKVFGSLSSSSSTTWSLTDSQLERRIWNRDKGDDHDDQTPVSSSFDDLLHTRRNRKKGLQDLSDDEQHTEGGDQDRDEWDIRSSIGLDPTLDNEEEEDAYDKMAEGRENAGDRLYMKDVTDHGPYLNSHNVLPITVEDATKDPRANHDAAKTRLKEDDGGGEQPGSDEPMLNAIANEPCANVASSRYGIGIKSILKRKTDGVAKSAKRVRFDPTCKDHSEASEANEDTSTAQSINCEPHDSEDVRGVPDYILNPSKYTRYSIDDSCGGVSEASNRQACFDFLEHIKSSKHVGLEQESADVPKSVTFIPRKKCNGEGRVKQSSTETGPGVSIAVEEVQQGDESTAIEEDETQEDAPSSKGRSHKAGRRYRTKVDAEDDVS